MPMTLPGAGLDDLDRDRTQCDCCFDRANRASVFEPRRRALFRHRLRAFNQSVDWFMPIDEVADRCDVDRLFPPGPDNRNIDAFHQHRGGPVSNLDDSQSAANARIDAQNLHKALLWPLRGVSPTVTENFSSVHHAAARSASA